MTTIALQPLAALTLLLLLLAVACAPSGQVGYGAADRTAMDALHRDAPHAAGLRPAAVR